MAFMGEHTKARLILDYEDGRAALSEALPEFTSHPENFGSAGDLPIGALATVFRVKEAAQEKLWVKLSTIEVPDRVEVPPIAPDPGYEGPGVALASARISVPAAGRVNETVEIAFEGPSHGNPFTDVELHAYFSLDGVEIRVGGFYDGNGRYLVRFLPERPGQWQFRTESTARSLNGHAGTVRVEPGPARGAVRVAESFHFAYTDGEVYRPVGTTLYAWTHQSPELEKKTLETLATSPFTKVRMCVFPKGYIFNDNDPGLYPFERDDETWDTTHFNPRFFQHLEDRIRDLGALGIEADVILFHPYDRWGFQDLGAAADDRYLRYVVRRLAAIPNVWWSLANEYDFLTAKTSRDWERFAKIVTEEDHANHLLSIHNGTRVYDFSAQWATHCSLQKVDYYKSAELVEDLREKWGKPVIMDEIGYEGDLEYEWGNLSAQEVVRRVWETNLRGGYYTHGETYYHPEDVLWWAKGGELVGQSADRIAFLDKLVAESPTGRLEPLSLAGVPTPAGGVAGEYELHYYGYSQCRYVTVSVPEGRDAVIDIIDTWAMTTDTLPGTYSGRPRVELPARPFMAVRVRVNKAP
ncbi:hypothetical protein StoSoilA2_22280 [Arthrobacter sp. StoSoilA2]|uniref:DUF5605 domain-containing protein n=1 Tax=Arthrobacter sp. StoSoilA2 TaxID=2830990 RepID=UPI001CC4C53F|nr:DUF5605 domain-containing protein [Arthrobacter sp. StoSoilA2]BCW36172.1 hypothetical protein StoSoilA2_22280 [Arthrobacter sp. StoSoilA2]